jgi:hypothetical protein
MGVTVIFLSDVISHCKYITRRDGNGTTSSASGNEGAKSPRKAPFISQNRIDSTFSDQM